MRSSAPFRPRRPLVADGPAIHRLITRCPPLDRNSPYAYLLLCRDFAETTVVVDSGHGELAGTITGYRPAQRPDTLFVWQVAVLPAFRGQGLARRMLTHLLERPCNHEVAWVEATVGPDNAASQALFAGLAAAHGTGLATTPLFDDRTLGPGHEPEILHRVGPLAVRSLQQAG